MVFKRLFSLIKEYGNTLNFIAIFASISYIILTLLAFFVFHEIKLTTFNITAFVFGISLAILSILFSIKEIVESIEYSKEVIKYLNNYFSNYHYLLTYIYDFFLVLKTLFYEYHSNSEKSSFTENKIVKLIEDIKSKIDEFKELREINIRKVSFLELLKENISYLISKDSELLQIVYDKVNFIRDSFISEVKSKKKFEKTLLLFIYNIDIMVEIANRYMKNINSFSYNTLLEVINNFSGISDFAININKNIESSMKDIIDPDNEKSFVSMKRGAENLKNTFELFYKDIQDLKDSSYNFIDTTTKNLKEVEKINQEIQRIARTMHILSINVGIEAANVGDAKGFQVLARDIREFADKTNNFVISVKKTIDDTIKSTLHLREGFEVNIKKVFSYLEVIKLYLERLVSSLSYATPLLHQSVDKLREFSSNLDKSVKESIVNLQTQDLVKQEIDHMEALINNINNEFSTYKDKIGFDIKNNMKRKDILKDILVYLDTIVTTKNERAILKEIKEKYGIEDEDIVNDSIDDGFIVL